MFSGMSFYAVCWYFILYSFIGWTIEVAFHAVTIGKIINRGFLAGPICPVYGFGMIAVLFIMSFLPVNPETGQVNTWLTFLTGSIFTTLVELIAGWGLDKLFHARWWDYSDMPFNFHGYICLAFCIIWGLAVTLALKVLHPFIHSITVALIPQKYGIFILAFLYTATIVDAVITILSALEINKDMERLNALRDTMRKPSDAMSNIIGKNTIKMTTSVQEARVKVALGKADLKDDLNKQRKEYQKRYFELKVSFKWTKKRLLNAFPKLQSTKYIQGIQELRQYLKDFTKRES
ncbi:MAG: putative ABC transporter permease [Treponema sp.]|nr:putative ABC transporter permease [Treponema sp.]